MKQHKKTSTDSKQQLVEKYAELREVLEDLGDFSYLDELPQSKDRVASMPFPYGSKDARPYGWFLS